MVWELYPQTLDHPTYGAAHEVARTGAPAEIVWRLPGGQEWFEQRITRSGRLVAIASREVTAARDDVERRRRLSRISEALASAETPEQVCVVITDLALPLAGASSGGVIAQDDPGWIRSLRWVGIDAATATEFARYPLTTLAPGAEAMRERELVWGGDEVIGQRWPAIAPALERAGARSVAGVPMVVRGEALGALVLQFTAATPPDAGTTDFMRTVAAVCAQALHRTQRLAAEHEAALLLQRSLLPQVPDRLDRVTLDARYRPGDPGVEVGGDWYDVVPLGGGQLLLVVADVQGHDLIAATVMGQLRSVTRALALEGLAPGALLARLEQFLGQVTTDRIVTALVVLVDAAARFVVAASAGHLAPLVLAPPGTPGGPCAASPLAVEPGPPLGVGESAVWPETTTTLAPGATVLAFTDGLVETRRRDVEDAVTALAATLAEPPAPVTPAELVGRALEFLPPGERGDDVAVLAVRIDADDALAPRLARRSFPPQEIAVPLARRWLLAVLDAWGLGGTETAEGAPLVLTELVSNAVRHTRTGVGVVLRLLDDDPEWGRALDIGVGDDSHRLPAFLGWPDDGAASGRGLLLVSQLAGRVRVEQHADGGKTVHALLPV